jgi:hypothetical protein
MKKVEIEIENKFDIDKSRNTVLFNGNNNLPYLGIPLKIIEVKDFIDEDKIKQLCWLAYVHYFSEMNLDLLIPEFNKWFENHKQILK